MAMNLRVKASNLGMSSVTSGEERQSLGIESTADIIECTRARVPSPQGLHLFPRFAQHYA